MYRCWFERGRGSIFCVEIGNVFSRMGEKEVLYLQNVFKKTRSHDVPVRVSLRSCPTRNRAVSGSVCSCVCAVLCVRSQAIFIRFLQLCSNYYGLFIVSFNICESLTLLLCSFVSAQLLYFSIWNKKHYYKWAGIR